MPAPVRQDVRLPAGQRRGARRARADDEAAPDHRAAPQGRAEHRRHADDVQRRRHERGDDAAQRVQGRVREAPRREARLHGLLREGLPRRRCKEIPAVNAEIDGDEIVYKNYYHIGVAVGTEQGLVVPGGARRRPHEPRRDRDSRSPTSASAPATASSRIEDLQGGTFTITNGGVFGSLLSTPILNAPQSGILGMHRIEERPVVRDGQVVVRPMMYLALSYDHRIVDGTRGGHLPGARQGVSRRIRERLHAGGSSGIEVIHGQRMAGSHRILQGAYGAQVVYQDADGGQAAVMHVSLAASAGSFMLRISAQYMMPTARTLDAPHVAMQQRTQEVDVAIARAARRHRDHAGALRYARRIGPLRLCVGVRRAAAALDLKESLP